MASLSTTMDFEPHNPSVWGQALQQLVIFFSQNIILYSDIVHDE